MPTRKLKVKGTKKVKRTKTLNAGRALRARQACKFQPFKLAKKDAFSWNDIKTDKAKVGILPFQIIQILNDYGYTAEHASYKKLFRKLSARTFKIDFVGDFYEAPGDNLIWELSCMYNDIIKIKEHLLEKQIQSLLGSIGKGYIEIDDI
jgi:hypothetical protein